MHKAYIQADYIDGTYVKDISGDVPSIGALLVQLSADFLNENSYTPEAREKLFDVFVCRIRDVINGQERSGDGEERKDEKKEKGVSSLPHDDNGTIVFDPGLSKSRRRE